MRRTRISQVLLAAIVPTRDGYFRWAPSLFSHFVKGCVYTIVQFQFCFCFGEAQMHAGLLLPDLVGLERQPNVLHGWRLDTDRHPGRVLMRFNVQIPNVGNGPLEVRTVNRTSEGLQDIFQRTYDSSGAVFEQFVGTFPITPSSHGGLNLIGIAQYSLHTLTASDGVGPSVATNTKTSRCLVDSVVFDVTLPAAPAESQYLTCHADIYGISVGRADFYLDYFEEQWIDVTGLPAGRYWLETIIDPFNVLQELDESNNTARILIDLPTVIPEPSASHFLVLVSAMIAIATICRKWNYGPHRSIRPKSFNRQPKAYVSR